MKNFRRPIEMSKIELDKTETVKSVYVITPDDLIPEARKKLIKSIAFPISGIRNLEPVMKSDKVILEIVIKDRYGKTIYDS